MTPRDRAQAVVFRWYDDEPRNNAGLVDLIEKAIDEHVVEWLTALSAANPGIFFSTDPGPVSMKEPDPPVCLHATVKWNSDNSRLVCAACGEAFKAGTCILCGQPAVSQDSFTCGKGTSCRNVVFEAAP